VRRIGRLQRPAVHDVFSSMRHGLRNWVVLAENVRTEIFGSLEAITPGMAGVVPTPHLPGRQDLARLSLRVAGLPQRGIRNSRACLNWRKRATFRSDGRAGLGLSYLHDWSD
jgi:hypothetical protein